MSDVRIGGLGGYVERMLARLSAGPGDVELREIQNGLSTTSRRLEASLKLKRIEPAQLTAAARALRGWVAFMAEGEQASVYAAVVAKAQPLVSAAAVGTRWHRPVRVQLRPMRGIYKIRNQPTGAVLAIPTAAICFEDADFTALAASVFQKDRAAGRHVTERMQSEEFQSIAAELEVLGGVVEETTGRHHNLADSFTRMNAEYFGGSIERPRIYWSRSLTRRKFGHYDWIGDAVMISRTLDAADVPRFVVDFVMFHELLHKHHGVRWTGGRRFAHTPEFRRQEKRFAQMPAAEKILSLLARAGQKGRGG